MTGPKLKLLKVSLRPIRGCKDSNLDLLQPKLNAPLSVGDANAPMSGPKLKSHHAPMSGPKLKSHHAWVVLRVHLVPIRGAMREDSNLNLLQPELNAPLSVGDPKAPMQGAKTKVPPCAGGVKSTFTTNKGLWGLEPGPCPTRSWVPTTEATPHSYTLCLSE